MQTLVSGVRWCFLALLLMASTLESAQAKKKTYPVAYEPIDVVIPFSGRGTKTLELCIESVRKHVQNVNRIIIISDKRYTKAAEWFDESKFHFSKFEIAEAIFKSEKKARHFLQEHEKHIGWIYQQLLKLYAPFVIDQISSNVLVVDADVIFLKPVTFIREDGGAYFTPSDELYPPYFAHMKRVLPGLKKVDDRYSGIAHHMLLQREILRDLMLSIESHHNMHAWKAIVGAIEPSDATQTCMSEYEMYFNFALSMTGQVKVRPLKWTQISSLHFLPEYTEKGYDFVSCHEYPEN